MLLEPNFILRVNNLDIDLELIWLEDVGLDTRIINALRRYRVATLGQLVRFSDENLSSIRNIGPRALDQIRERALSILDNPKP